MKFPNLERKCTRRFFLLGKYVLTVSAPSFNFFCKELLRDRSKGDEVEGLWFILLLPVLLFSSDEMFSPDLFVIMNRDPLLRREAFLFSNQTINIYNYILLCARLRVPSFESVSFGDLGEDPDLLLELSLREDEIGSNITVTSLFLFGIYTRIVHCPEGDLGL